MQKKEIFLDEYIIEGTKNTQFTPIGISIMKEYEEEEINFFEIETSKKEEKLNFILNLDETLISDLNEEINYNKEKIFDSSCFLSNNNNILQDDKEENVEKENLSNFKNKEINSDSQEDNEETNETTKKTILLKAENSIMNQNKEVIMNLEYNDSSKSVKKVQKNFNKKNNNKHNFENNSKDIKHRIFETEDKKIRIIYSDKTKSFLENISKCFEIYVYSLCWNEYIEEIIKYFDNENKFIKKENVIFGNSEVIRKNLENLLNLDLKKCIFMDNSFEVWKKEELFDYFYYGKKFVFNKNSKKDSIYQFGFNEKNQEITLDSTFNNYFSIYENENLDRFNLIKESLIQICHRFNTNKNKFKYNQCKYNLKKILYQIKKNIFIGENFFLAFSNEKLLFVVKNLIKKLGGFITTYPSPDCILISTQEYKNKYIEVFTQNIPIVDVTFIFDSFFYLTSLNKNSYILK
jgi:hypothetical protein